MENADYLRGRVAWVTGSARGIGRAIARELAAAGCKIVLHGRSRTGLQSSGEGTDIETAGRELAAECGAEVMTVCGDLSDENAVACCYGEIVGKFGKPEILVCNAGGTSAPQDIKQFDRNSASSFELPSFNFVMNNNILPTILCCRAAVPAMRENGWGRIVTIGSIAGCGGHKTGGKAFLSYSIAKNSIHQYTRCLAAELRHDGIPVNCVIPGNINTPVTRLKFGGDREKPQENLSRLEHVGIPEDIARTVAFLCGQGGEYITGQCLRVDGGEQLSPC